eukprot:1987026-Ditylum_brightwellii.AAC.1
MGETCRVAKIDSDRNQEWAAKLRIEGLPTVIVFDQNGKEVGRREGLLMKSNLVDFVKRNTVFVACANLLAMGDGTSFLNEEGYDIFFVEAFELSKNVPM